MKKCNASFLFLITINVQLLDNNRPKTLPKIWFLSQVFNIYDKLSDSKSVPSKLVVESKSEFKINKEAVFFSFLFRIELDEHFKLQKKD